MLERSRVGYQGDTLLTKIVALTLVICTLLDTVVIDALVVAKNFVRIFAPRSRKRHSATASARAVDAQIDSRSITPSKRRSGWAKPQRVVPERS
jgi:hypothetical protein